MTQSNTIRHSLCSIVYHTHYTNVSPARNLKIAFSLRSNLNLVCWSRLFISTPVFSFSTFLTSKYSVLWAYIRIKGPINPSFQVDVNIIQMQLLLWTLITKAISRLSHLPKHNKEKVKRDIRQFIRFLRAFLVDFSYLLVPV